MRRETARRQAAYKRKHTVVSTAAPSAVAAVETTQYRPYRRFDADTWATIEQAIRAAVGSTVTRHGVRRSEDLQQQAWVEALRAFDSYDSTRGTRLGAHICGVVRLRLLDWMRRESPLSRKQILDNQRARADGRPLPWQSMHASFDASAAQDHFAALADENSPDAFEAVEDRMVGRDVTAAARKMFAHDARLSFLLEYVILGGHTMRDASEQLELSASRIEQLVNRTILPQLRERFSVGA